MVSKSGVESNSVLEDYKSSLNDLVFNSKPLINVLTMLAEENEIYADGIVKVIKDRIKRVDIKLKMPSLYLLDSILKNVGGDFINILSLYMIEIFTDVFENGDEKIRMSLFKLRNTWPQYFPTKFLYELDLSVKELDPNWPVVEQPTSAASIHVNPKFLVQGQKTDPNVSEESIRIAHLQAQQAQQHEEKLREEERRIKEQLKRLQEEQLKLQRSRLEEERSKREELLKKQQADRERVMIEQQRQIQALKMQQETGSEIKSSSVSLPPFSPKKAVQVTDIKKKIDPRLARREMQLNSLVTRTDQPIPDDADAAKMSSKTEAIDRDIQDLRPNLSPKPQETSSKSSLPVADVENIEKVVAKPLVLVEVVAKPSSDNQRQLEKETGPVKSSNADSFMASKSSGNSVHATVKNGQKDAIRDTETGSVNASSHFEAAPDVEVKAIKRAVLEDKKNDVVVSRDVDKATEERKESAMKEPTEAPPTKKRKSDEKANLSFIPMDVEDIELQEDEETNETENALPENHQSDDEKGSSENTSPLSDDKEVGSRFRKRNRSEWRKLMIEKAKLERRQRIPSEKELPREMRFVNHEELLNKLKIRLDSGEIKEDEYSALVKQLDLMYEVQRVRETPEKHKASIEDRNEQGMGTKISTAEESKGMTADAAKADKTENSTQRAGKFLSQKETNQDLIRQLREKRINVEREQRENEWKLKREWNIDQMKEARGRRDRDQKDRDIDSRVRRGFENRTGRITKEYESDFRNRRRNRERERDRRELPDERSDYSRSRFSRDRDTRQRRFPSPVRDRRLERQNDASPIKRISKSSETNSLISSEARGRESPRANDVPDQKSIDQSKVELDNAKCEGNEDVRQTTENTLANENVEKSYVELAFKEQPGKTTAKNSPLWQSDDTSQKSKGEDSNPQDSILSEAKDDIVTNEASSVLPSIMNEEEKDDRTQGNEKSPSYEDSSKTVVNLSGDRTHSIEKRRSNSFKIPKKERPNGHKAVKQDPIEGSLDDDVRMLSWRHQEGDKQHQESANPMIDRRTNRYHAGQEGLSRRNAARRNKKMFKREGRRGTPPSADRQPEPGPLGPHSIPLNERPHSWREMHDQEFHSRFSPDLERRPFGDMEPQPDDGPHYQPGVMDKNIDMRERFPMHQEHFGDSRKMSPMHQPDAPMRPRTDIDHRFHPGPQLRDPGYREPEFHGSPFGEPRFADPRIAGPINDFGDFQERGHREVEGAPVDDRDFRGPHFGPSDHRFEENRGFRPDDHPVPQDGVRYIEDPPNVMERRVEYYEGREPPPFDNRYGGRGPWRENHPAQFRHSPFHENRMDNEFDRQFPFPHDQRRQFPTDPDRPMPYQPGPPGFPDQLNQQQRKYIHNEHGLEGFRQLPHEYQERIPSPLPFEYANQQGQHEQFARISTNDGQYSVPGSSGFALTNPLMKMIENVKRNAGESIHVDHVQKPPQASQSFIGVSELFHKLVSTGVITTPNVASAAEKSATPPPRLETQEEIIPEINFVMEDLKKRHFSIINTLYLGSQCSSCGLRYPESEKQLYRDHLDWHFRVNRREKENKKSISRPWFYSIEQWCDMDDVIDVEEAAKSNVFESEAKRDETTVETGDGSCSVLHGQDDSYCNICFDTFEQFWDEALEEWRYKEAVRVKGKTYHINCYDDMEADGFLSGTDQELNDVMDEQKLSPVAFPEFLRSERPDETQKSDENFSQDYQPRFGTIIVKKEPEDVGMDDQDRPPNNRTTSVTPETGDMRIIEEHSSHISDAASEIAVNLASVKSEPDQPIAIKTEPEESSAVEGESSQVSLSLQEKQTEALSLNNESFDLPGLQIEQMKVELTDSSVSLSIPKELETDCKESETEIVSKSKEEIRSGDSVSANAIDTVKESTTDKETKQKDEVLASVDVIDVTKESVKMTETKPITMQDAVKDRVATEDALLGDACEKTSTNVKTDVEDGSLVGTNKTEDIASDVDSFENDGKSKRAADEDADPKIHSEQFAANSYDKDIHESVIENKEMKNIDEINELEGKPHR